MTLVEELSAIGGREQMLDGEAARQAYTRDMSWLSIATAAHARPLSRHQLVVSDLRGSRRLPAPTPFSAV